MRLQPILIVSLLVVSSLRPAAQSLDEKDFTLYTIKEGLTDNRVTAAVQDKYGYIWIATEKGLNRYDGNSFQSFYSDSGASSLPQDGIIKLKWLDKEQLAASTVTGLHIINTRSLATRNLTIPPDSLKYADKVNRIQDMAGDTTGNVFILTRSGFYQFNNKNELVFRYDHYRKEEAGNTTFIFGRNLALADNGRMLLSTNDGLYVYEPTGKKIFPINSTADPFHQQVARPGDQFFFKHSDPTSFSLQTEITKETFYFDLLTKTKRPVMAPFSMPEKFNWRSAIYKLNDSVFAITGREKGFYLIRYNEQLNQYDILPKLYFENYFCSFLFIDKNNRLWIGTTKGLFRENRLPGGIEKIVIPAEANPFNLDLSIRGFTIANNKLFVATAGAGLLVFDSKTMRLLKTFEFRHSPASVNSAYHVIKLNEDTVLAGGVGTFLYINTKNLMAFSPILPGWKQEEDWVGALFKDSRNNIYVCSELFKQFYLKKANENKFSLLHFQGNSLFNIETTRYITEDNDGNIWFSGHGTTRFNYRLQQFDLRIDSFPSTRILRRQVLGLLFDAKGKMYFGMPDNGLILYDPAKKNYEHYTRNNGLPDNTIEALHLHKNLLWMGTGSGLASFDIITKKVSSFGISDNMPAGPYTGYSFYFDPVVNQLYGLFNNTLLRFDPDKLTKNNSPPDFFIESIEITDERIIHHPDNRVELSYRHNNLILNLAAINFEDAYQQKFAYRFVNNGNEPWRQIGSQRNIIFSDLSPGKHILQLKVFIKNNSWPEQVKEIEIYIRPPFWQTTWFRILAIAVILSILYLLYRYRIKTIRQKANIDKQLSELEMKGLHSQMNPHFIFNSLNSIREMILANENKEASHYLSKFAHLIRITLDHSSQSLVSLRSTFEYLERYIEMEQIRNNQFTCTIKKDDVPDPDETLIPPMLIQPFIENALWHGVSPGSKDIHIRVEFKKEQDNLVCIIDDNGIGINQSVKEKNESGVHHQPVGISNIRNRIALLNEKYNIGCSISIKDKSDSNETGQTGTLVMLKLPLEIKEG